jgi:ABC-type nitrate/sulfonate/bicarbonate transport system permease component
MATRDNQAQSFGSRLVQVGFLIAVLVLWYLATTRWGVNRLLLPNPVAVWQQLLDVLRSGEYLPDLRVTLTELVIAFALAMTSGTIVGFFVSRRRYTIRVFDPLFAAIYSIPIIMFLPLYVLFFGLGPASKIALGATISFFPIVLSTIAGFGNVDRTLVTAARSMGASDYPPLSLRAGSRRAPGHSERITHGIYHGPALHHRQRDHRFARRPRSSHRATSRRHGYGAHVRLHRLRRRDRGTAQWSRFISGSPRETLGMSAQAFLLRHPGVVRLGVVLLLLLIWEIAARWLIDPMFISPPSRVLASLGSVWQTPGVPAALRLTFFELAVAFAIAVVLGLSIGLAVGLQPFTRRSLMPIILLIYGLPQITILPIFILFFGIGAPSKIAFGVTHGTFPIIIAVVAGLQNIKPILLTSARSMGANRWHILRWVIFPHMIPSFFSGMRLGMTGVLLGVLLAELYVSTAGIGHFTTLFTENFDPTKLFGLVAMLAAMAIVLNEMVRRAELRFSRWR